MSWVKKGVVGLGLSMAATIAVRLGAQLADDISRYDRIRRMSGEGSILGQIPAMAADTIAAERGAFGDLADLVRSLPRDIARYAYIKSL